jgi:L-lactate dehydrogenase complex protein LldE
MHQPKTIALCVTCLVDQLYPEIGVAAVRLLRDAGYEVEFPAAQTCCGQPFFNSGFQAEATRLARRTIEIFEPYPAVVVPSGSCVTMMRIEYPHLFEHDPAYAERAHQLAAKTYELTEFLAGQASSQSAVGSSQLAVASEQSTVTDDSPLATPHSPLITYHDSCHMCRLLGLGRQPRQLLQAAGYESVEMAESDRCCGFGGLFSIRMSEVSNAMTAEKLRQAEASGATVLATADPGCLMQMRGLASAAGRPLRIEHVATLLEKVSSRQ